jgi:Flp pilus assembly protein TadG
MIIRQFGQDQRGSVIPLFAICIFAVFAAVGAAVDYSRAAKGRSEMQAALDAAAITLSKEADKLDAAQLKERAQAIFEASFKDSASKKITVKPTYTNVNGVYKLAMQATGALDTTVFHIFGQNTMDIKANTEVEWGMRRLELALALDNTGSMAQLGKIDALKTATHSLIDTLKEASKKKDDIKVAIVPFTTYVNVDPKKSKAKWIDFSGWTETASIGTEANLSSEWINPKTGKKWSGCVTDRTQPYDAQDTAPDGAVTLFPAVECTNPVPLIALTSNWKKLHDKVDEMKADGTTNVTIGMAWGWHALTSGRPLTEGEAPAKDLDKVLVLLTDGENTENRWSTNSSDIDKRTEAVCANIKKDNIKIYTVRVVEGNAALLRGCANGGYFEVAQASQLNDVFKNIAKSLATLRIAK